MELLPRRFVVEQYARYDARKKNRPVPLDFDDWDWSNADAIDARLKSSGFKTGIIAGYLSWKPTELNKSELASCAIVSEIFPGLPRTLGQLVSHKQFKTWKPDRNAEWYEPLMRGEDLAVCYFNLAVIAVSTTSGFRARVKPLSPGDGSFIFVHKSCSKSQRDLISLEFFLRTSAPLRLCVKFILPH